MPETSSLYTRVRAVIAKKAGMKVEDIKCPADLGEYLTDLQKLNLAPLFQEIAREFRPAARVTQAETGELETVLEAYNLVGNKAGMPEVKCSDVPPLPA